MANKYLPNTDELSQLSEHTQKCKNADRSLLQNKCTILKHAFKKQVIPAKLNTSFLKTY